jgi:hypothetical protein
MDLLHPCGVADKLQKVAGSELQTSSDPRGTAVSTDHQHTRKCGHHSGMS